MDRSLFHLIRLLLRGFIRRMTHGARSPRRSIFLLIGVGVIVLWLGPSLIGSFTLKHMQPQRLAAARERFRAVAPLALLGICILTIVSSAGDKAISFTPGEVDLLFPGPFTRRQLLAYKLIKSGLAALFTGLLMSILMLAYATSWAACYVGVVLTLLFIQWFSTAGVLLGQTLGKRAHSALRRVVLVAALLLAALLARQWIAARGGGWALIEFRYSDLGEKLLAPFDAFARVMVSEHLREFLPAAAEAALIDLGLLFVVLLLDAEYLEAALAASKRRYTQLQRIRGGSLLSSSVRGDARWRLPQLPWAGGAGPIVWRQATSAFRSAKGLLLLMLIVAVGIGPIFASELRGANISVTLVTAMAWLTVLLSGLVKFDFRGDLDHMEELKALPLRPSTLALGQMTVPTLILTSVHVLMLLGVAAVLPAHRDVVIVAACLALPFNALLMASENLIFLLFPTRPAAASPGDFQVLGRQAAQLVMKAMAVLFGCVIAFAVAAPAYILTGGSLIVLTLVSAAVMAAETLGLVPAIAWAFTRFDPSTDTPA